MTAIGQLPDGQSTGIPLLLPLLKYGQTLLIILLRLSHGGGIGQRHQILRLTLRLTPRKRKLRTVKHTVQCVVVFRSDRVVLVIVTARTAQRQTQKVLAQIVNDILVHQMDVLVDVMTKSTSDRQIAGGHNAVSFRLTLSLRKQVTRQLQSSELIEWQIRIQGLHHPVTVSPRVRQRPVGIFTSGIGITHHVQPVPSPVHAVLRGLQQPLNLSLPRSR